MVDNDMENILDESVDRGHLPKIFQNYFWDDQLSGYDILCQNLKNSQTTVKELESYIRECINSEDQYVKQLNRTTTQMHKFLSDSIMAPIWQEAVKKLNEQNSLAHLHFMHCIIELTKEIQSYGDMLRKKRRALKEKNVKTEQVMDAWRVSKQQLAKCREQYQQANAEKARGTSDELDTKLDKKLSMLRDDYLGVIERHNVLRADYESRFADACDIFQTHEEQHLTQMRVFLRKYAELLAQLNQLRSKHLQDYQDRMSRTFTDERLIEKFIDTRSTGTARPLDVEFSIDAELSTSFKNGTSVSSRSHRRSTTSPINFTLPKSNKKHSTASIFDTTFFEQQNSAKRPTDLPLKERETSTSLDQMALDRMSLTASSQANDLQRDNNSSNTIVNMADTPSGKEPAATISRGTFSNLFGSIDFLGRRRRGKESPKSGANSKQTNEQLSTTNTSIVSLEQHWPSTSPSPSHKDVSFDTSTAKSFDDLGTSLTHHFDHKNKSRPVGSLETATSLNDRKLYSNGKMLDANNNDVSTAGTPSIHLGTSFDDMPSRTYGQLKNGTLKESDGTISDSNSDTDSDDSDEPKKPKFVIRPKCERDGTTSPEVLIEISKKLNLHLRSPSQPTIFPMSNSSSDLLKQYSMPRPGTYLRRNEMEMSTLTSTLRESSDTVAITSFCQHDENQPGTLPESNEKPSEKQPAAVRLEPSRPSLLSTSPPPISATPPPLPHLPVELQQKVQEQLQRLNIDVTRRTISPVLLSSPSPPSIVPALSRSAANAPINIYVPPKEPDQVAASYDSLKSSFLLSTSPNLAQQQQLRQQFIDDDVDTMEF